MTEKIKKPAFLAPFARFFTVIDREVYDSIPFAQTEWVGDEVYPALTAPCAWEGGSLEVMAEAAALAVPLRLQVIEENTVPSWLWRRKALGRAQGAEGDLRPIFDRVVGAALAKAWALGLFTSERPARALYDEARYALIHRHVMILPEVIAPLGLSWAYGIEVPLSEQPSFSDRFEKNLRHTQIEAAQTCAAPLWKQIFASGNPVTLRLGDIAADWQTSPLSQAGALLDLMKFRREDGSLNSEALQQAARLTVVLLDLHGRSDVTLGLANLAPLLLALGLTYDSEAARATAASLTALVTAACLAASAEMAALRGASDSFTTHRSTVLRSLRNHHRAVHGDGSDYEKLSVLPTPLPLRHAPDLALLAEAQRGWNEALEKATAFGLRATAVTDLTPSPSFALLMEGGTQGVEPLSTLTLLQPEEGGGFSESLHPAVGEALARLGYQAETAQAATRHVTGLKSLRRTPYINHGTLRAHGLDGAAIERIEAYLPSVDTIRLALTPWIVGPTFCRGVLKIPASVFEAPGFSLLAHMGFDAEEIKAADQACYGNKTLRSAIFLALRHRPLFGCGAEVGSEARLRMAAALQGFVSGDTGLVLTLSLPNKVESAARLVLDAWRNGLKAVHFIFEETVKTPPVLKNKARRLVARPLEKPVAVPRVPERVRKQGTATNLRGRGTTRRSVPSLPRR